MEQCQNSIVHMKITLVKAGAVLLLVGDVLDLLLLVDAFRGRRGLEKPKKWGDDSRDTRRETNNEDW